MENCGSTFFSFHTRFHSDRELSLFAPTGVAYTARVIKMHLFSCENWVGEEAAARPNDADRFVVNWLTRIYPTESDVIRSKYQLMEWLSLPNASEFILARIHAIYDDVTYLGNFVFIQRFKHNFYLNGMRAASIFTIYLLKKKQDFGRHALHKSV